MIAALSNEKARLRLQPLRRAMTTTNPLEGLGKLMMKHSIATPEGASAVDPLAPRGPMSVTVDMAALSAMDMDQLGKFRDAMHTLGDVLCGFVCQPRFTQDDCHLNQAGKLIDQILAFVCSYEQAAVNVAAAAKPNDALGIEERAWIILGFEADMAESLPGMSAIAAEAVLAVSDSRSVRAAA